MFGALPRVRWYPETIWGRKPIEKMKFRRFINDNVPNSVYLRPGALRRA
jgi:hypothetical protein